MATLQKSQGGLSLILIKLQVRVLIDKVILWVIIDWAHSFSLSFERTMSNCQKINGEFGTSPSYLQDVIEDVIEHRRMPHAWRNMCVG